MRPRQPLPRLWLMTDERFGAALLPALARLPAHYAGIVFRHHCLPEAERWALFEEVRSIAQRRRLMLLLAGSAEQAEEWGADGSHGRGPATGFRSAPVHDLAEIRAAERDGAHLLFLSPVFATSSHPGARPLGPARFNHLARRTDRPVIALGGMNALRARRLREAYGWAGIDAFQSSPRFRGEGDQP